MDPCELINEWNDLTEDERGDNLDAFVQSTLADWGFDGVRVEVGSTPDAWAWYDPKTGTITIDSDHLKGYDALRMLAVCIHEAYHAVQDQAQGLAGLTDEELEAMRPYLELGADEARIANMQSLIDDCAAWDLLESVAVQDLPADGPEAAWA